MIRILLSFIAVISIILPACRDACAAAETEPVSFVFVRQCFDGTTPVFIGEKNRKMPVLEIIPSGDTAAAEIAGTLKGGMSKISLALGGYVKNFMLGEVEAGRSTQKSEIFREPLYIHLVRGGNMPKRGFYLKSGAAVTDKSFAHYIEMPPEPLAFESIFAHENGHLIDAYIQDSDFGFSPDRFVHTAPAISDFWTAFVEGWGEHFETMMADMTENAACRNLYTFEDARGREYFSHLQDIANLSHKSKRHQWVKSNMFAFKRTPVSRELEMRAGGRDVYLYNHFNANFDFSELKNIQQMLSTEGFVATLFYRLVRDAAIQSGYLSDKSFYEKFYGRKLETEPREIFSPLENAYLKIIFAKRSLFKKYETHEALEEAMVFADFIMEYAAAFSADARAALGGFCMNSYFAGVWEDAAAFYRKNYRAAHLTLFEPETLRKSFSESFQRIQKTIDGMGTSGVGLKLKYAGVPLWIVNDTFNLGDESEKFFVSINLNAAEEYELASISFLTKGQAADIASRRDNKGFFSVIGDLSQVPSLSASQIKKLAAMRRLFVEKHSKNIRNK